VPPATHSAVYGTDYFNRGHWLTAYQVRSSLALRARIFAWLCRHVTIAAGTRVLELGATPDIERADSNCFGRWCLARGADTTFASVEDIAHLPEHIPGAHTVAWEQLSDAGQTFDLVVSSAVLEHTGTHARSHIALCLALGRAVLLLTPNRGHWMEFHTKLPLLHWLPRRSHRALLRLLGMPFWAREDSLHLYAPGELRALCQGVMDAQPQPWRVTWLTPRFWGFISHLVALMQEQS
jgi:hypothetical protein